jgi:putative membrane protein
MKYKTLIVGIALAVATASGAGAQSGDQAFVTKMGGVALAEIELGNIARDKASSRDVKGFGQRMIDDHGQAGRELKVIAERKNLTWPSALPPDAVALKERLAKLSGAAFDRAYIDAMVSGHKDVLGVVKTHAQSGGDAEVKAWATKASSSVQAHLTHAQEVQREIGKTATH